MIYDQAKLDAYLAKMLPKINKAANEANARPPRISVTKTDDGELMTIAKSGLVGKPLNLLAAGKTAKFWRKDPNNIEFEGNLRKDFILNHQHVGTAVPLGLCAVAIAMNSKEKSTVTEYYESGWWTFKEDVSEKDFDTFVDFMNRNKFVGSEFSNLSREYIDFFEDRDNSLCMKAGNGKLKKVKKLIELGFRPDAGGVNDTPLLYAISDYDKDEKQGDVIRYLLSLGANPNRFDMEFSQKNRGEAALFKMIDKLEDEVELELFELLLKHGADPNQKNTDKDTPLVVVAHRAEETGPAAARILLDYGANPALKGEDGRTALEIAEEEENEELVAVLR